MSATPRVSIGLPVYNGERYLRETLESLLAQTFTAFELIICDNASTDRTQEICGSYAARDSRIRYFCNAVNIGGFPNHNRVFAMACSEYFMWAADDDRRAPTQIERCVEVLDAQPEVVLCYTGSNRIDENGDPLPERFVDLDVSGPIASRRFAQLIQRNYGLEPIYGVIRSRVLAQTPLEAQYADSDRVLLAEIGMHGPFRKIDETLFSRREHPMRSTNVFPSRYERTAWFDPQHAGKIVFPFHREYYEYLRSIHRAPISAREKLRCVGHVIQWIRKNRRALVNDIRRFVHTLARPLVRRLRGRPVA